MDIEFTSNLTLTLGNWNDYGMYLVYKSQKLPETYRIIFLNNAGMYVYPFQDGETHLVISEGTIHLKTTPNQYEDVHFYGSGTFNYYKELANQKNMDSIHFNDTLKLFNDLLVTPEINSLKKRETKLTSEKSFYGYTENFTYTIDNPPLSYGLFRSYDPIYFFNFIENSKIDIFKFLNEEEMPEYVSKKLEDDNFTNSFKTWLEHDSEARQYLVDFANLLTNDRKNRKTMERIQRSPNTILNLIELVGNDTTLMQKFSKVFGEDDVSVVKNISEIEGILCCRDKKIPERLGQYTSNATLEFVLRNTSIQTDKKIPDLRLTNGNQLNDPMEGKVLLSILHLDKENSNYNSTNNFISSLTSEEDSLPMWKQYGGNASGIYVRFSEKYISKIKNNLYRTCYVTVNESIQDSVFDVPDDENASEKIKKNLLEIEEYIKKLHKQLKGNKDKYQERITMIIKYLDILSFLFKNSDYSYEREYRVLKNVRNLKLINTQVNNGKFMLYTNYFGNNISEDDQLEYSHIILGPNNANNLNYIAEYIKLTSPQTEVSISNIHYR